MPKIGEYKGYEIFYDTPRKRFTANVQNDTLEAASQTELENQIDRALKNAGVFPIHVIFCDGGRVIYGRITSYNPTDRRAWFVDEKGEREKPWALDHYYLDTATNRSVCEQVSTKLADIGRIRNEIGELEKQLEKPFLEHWKAIADVTAQ
jgi:hypothetical protein